MLNENAKIILVSGGKGGVGKSSVCAGLARGFNSIGMATGILDADITGPSQHVLFPTSNVIANKNAISIPLIDEIAVCSMGYFSETGSSLVWMDETIRSLFYTLLYESTWPILDVLIVDLPPSSGSVTRILLEFLDATNTIFVTTSSQLALADLRRDITYHRRLGSRGLGIVNNMAFIKCDNCGAINIISNSLDVEKISIETNLPILATFPYDYKIFNGNGCKEFARGCYGLIK